MTTYAELLAAPAGAKVRTEIVAVKDADGNWNHASTTNEFVKPGKLSVAEFVARLGKPTVMPAEGGFQRYQWWQNGQFKDGWIVEINVTPDWFEIYVCARMYAGPQVHLRVHR